MKLDVKSKNFKLSLFFIAAFIAHLFILQIQVKDYILNSQNGEELPRLYYYLPYLWISMAGLMFFKATKKKQTTQNQILAFVLTPIILSPVLGILYVALVLLPIYNLAGQTISN